MNHYIYHFGQDPVPLSTQLINCSLNHIISRWLINILSNNVYWHLQISTIIISITRKFSMS